MLIILAASFVFVLVFSIRNYKGARARERKARLMGDDPYSYD